MEWRFIEKVLRDAVMCWPQETRAVGAVTSLKKGDGGRGIYVATIKNGKLYLSTRIFVKPGKISRDIKR